MRDIFGVGVFAEGLCFVQLLLDLFRTEFHH